MKMRTAMAELGFKDQNQLLRSGFSALDASPDSIIFTPESNLSLFSSASASVGRSSFASDSRDHESIASEVSQHLSGNETQESSSGPRLNSNKHTVRKNSRISRKVDKAKVKKEDSETDAGDENQTLDSARSSFSLALKECQERRFRSETISKKSELPRTASFDLNNHVAGNSPRFGSVTMSSVSRRSGNFPSPGTPNYRHYNAGMQKGWSSERVALPHNGNRSQVNATLLPLNNGRTLPSKWEDAERWISSPVSGDGAGKPSQPHVQRKQKSKSGPLGPPGIAYYSLYSPAMPMFEAGNIGNFMSGSPFSAGVMATDSLAIQCGGHEGSFPSCMVSSMGRSASIHGCSEVLSMTIGTQEEIVAGVKDAATDISRDVSRRDMATQMSPEGSPHSSPKRPSISSALPVMELLRVQSSKSDIRVDDRVTVTRWSKKHRALVTEKGSENGNDQKKRDLEAQSSTWNVSESAKSTSRIQREDAKITAWENLQKAKAEAAIRKLEMKLEKKRSSSMDKIMNKLRLAQKKAQKMKSSVLANEAHQATRSSSHKAISFRRTRRMSSLSGCFTCHAF